MKATRESLWQFVEQPEPSTEGEWFVLDLDLLKQNGIQYVEIHFADGSRDGEPNEVRLTKEDGA